MKNQSAFPWVVDDGQKVIGDKGMTLRDYFAAKWLQGYMANSVMPEMTVDLAACKAYQMADAMLEARDA